MEWEYDYAGRAVYMDVNNGALTLAYDHDGDGGLQYLYRRGLRSTFLLDGRNVLREWVPITIVSPVTSVALRPRDLVRMPAAACAALAQCLRRLLADPGLRQQMGEAGRQRAWDRYTWDHIARRHYLPALLEGS